MCTAKSSAGINHGFLPFLNKFGNSKPFELYLIFRPRKQSNLLPSPWYYPADDLVD